MPQALQELTPTDQAEQSLAIEKMLASEIIAQWPADKPFDASIILADHPELRLHKSVVLDLAYEEYCCRTSRGETLDVHEFASRFRDIQRSLLCLIDVHQLLHQNPQFMEDATETTWPKVGETFQDLELTANLGRGAFARVFLARESGIGGRLVVSKLSKTGGREADFLGRLEHPQIVPIFSVKHDEERGLSAICMPYLGRTTLLDLIDGITARNSLPTSGAQLREIIQAFESTSATSPKHHKPIRAAWQRTSLDALIDLGIQLAEGLEFAHEQKICHGDIKPSNVLITPQGQAMLMDFNLSFQTQGDDKALGGTLPYMAPEQLTRVMGKGTDRVPASNEQTDIFAFGVVMYELLVGRYPFGSIPVNEPQRQAACKLLARQKSGFRPLREFNPNIDRQLAGCIEKCLSYVSAERWQTAAELRTALKHAGSLRQRSRRWLRRHRKTVLSAVVVASLAVSASAYGMMTREPYEIRVSHKAKEAYQTQEYDVAIELLNELLVLTPESPEVLFSLGRSYQGKEQFKDAFEYFNRVWKNNPDNKPNNACIAQCLAESARDNNFTREEKKGELKFAIENYKQAFGDPRVSEAALNNNIGYCYLALWNLEQVDEYFNTAEQYLRASLALDPYESITHHHLVVLNRLRAMNSPDLFDRQVLENAMRFADGDPETYLETARGYAYLLRNIKDNDERSYIMQQCVECCRRAIRFHLTPEKIGEVLSDLKVGGSRSEFPSEMDDLEQLRNQPASTEAAKDFNPLIDPVIEY